MDYQISYFYPNSEYAERFKLEGGYCVETGARSPEVKGFASYDEAVAFAKTIPNGYPHSFSLDHPSRMTSGFGVKA